MNITIYSKKPDSKGYIRLYMYVSIAGQPCWLPTKIKVIAESWNQDDQTITSKQYANKELIGMLNKRKGQLAKVFQDLEYEGVAPTPAIVLNRYKATLDHKIVKQGVKQMQLLEYFDQYVADRKAIRSDKGYLRKFKPVKNHLVQFNPEIRFKDITMQFYNDFLTYLYDDCELENNTVSGYIKKIKSVMSAAVIDQRTKHQDIPTDFKLFKDTYVKPKPFWLDWDTDVKKLETLTPVKAILIKDRLMNKEEQQLYKDEFLFRCYTGLRHVDLFNAKPENFIKRGNKIYLDFMSIKTRVDQNLQLNEKAMSILKKWNGKPPRLHQSDCNLVIKELCKSTGIDAMVEKVRFSGNERKVSLLPKFALTTTHTARRTFGRRWMENGGSIRNLCIYYGHATEKQTAEYIGWTTEEVNKEYMNVI